MTPLPSNSLDYDIAWQIHPGLFRDLALLPPSVTASLKQLCCRRPRSSRTGLMSARYLATSRLYRSQPAGFSRCPTGDRSIIGDSSRDGPWVQRPIMISSCRQTAYSMQNLLCQRGVQLIRDILRSLGESAAGEHTEMKCSLERVLLRWSGASFTARISVFK